MNYGYPLSLSIVIAPQYLMFVSHLPFHDCDPATRFHDCHGVRWSHGCPEDTKAQFFPQGGAVCSLGDCAPQNVPHFLHEIIKTIFFTWNPKKNYWENRIQHASIQCTEKGIWRWWNCTAHGSACEALLPGGCPSIHPWLRMVITIPPIWWLGDGAFMTWLKTHIIRIPIWDWWRSPQG